MKASFHNGATTVLLQGGHNPEIKLDYYIELVRRVREEIPNLHLHAFSAPEISAIAKYSGISTKEVLERLWEAGLRTIPGGGALGRGGRGILAVSALRLREMAAVERRHTKNSS